jgi:hypothetical protein
VSAWAATSTAVPRARTLVAHRRWLVVAACAAGALLALVVRARSRQAGLLYPDGYQYLLMARGIGDHLRPITQLGHGGEVFVPSVDAAAKPIFPALVALATAAGANALDAARAISVFAAAAVVVLLGMLAFQLTRSALAAIAAAGALLASPAAAFWSGFAGPDQLGIALALAAAILATRGRTRLAGVAGALACGCRPELTVVALAGVGACAASIGTPRFARLVEGLIAFVFTLAAILIVLRPPIALPTDAWLGALAVPAGAAAVIPPARIGARRRLSLVVATVLLAALAALAAGAPGASALAHSEAPLLLAGAVSVLLACAFGAGRSALALVLTAAGLAALYLTKNPSSERYLTLLLPLVCLSVALGVAVLSRNGRRAWCVALLALVVINPLASPARPALARDAFASLTPSLAHLPPGPLVSASPDAFGVLLPDRPQRELRAGARGLILLDGAARAYTSGLAARGQLVMTIPAGDGFARPDGRIDGKPVYVVRGVVVRLPRALHASDTAVVRAG